MSVLEQLKNLETFIEMGVGDKFTASLYVTLLGMGITFIVLIVIMTLTKLLPVFFAEKTDTKAVDSQNPSKSLAEKHSSGSDEATSSIESNQSLNSSSESIDSGQNDEELIAAITLAITMCMQENTRFVLKKITRIPDSTPIWGKVGTLGVMRSEKL